MNASFAIRMPPDIQALTIGEHQALIIDDFLEDPEALKSIAIASQFSEYPNFHNKKGYPGIRADAPADYSSTITALLEPVIKANFEVPEELPLRKSVCAFSLTTMPASELSELQRTPHFDASTPQHFAVLLYLCDERHGGTGFYRHRASGLQQITADNRERYLDMYYEEVNRERPAQRYFDASNAQFEFLGMIPAKFNRLVIYRGSLLHTACIHPQRSISADPSLGRLTVNTFYEFGTP